MTFPATRGPSVVLLHELGGTLNSWNKVAPRLAQNYRVLRYDQRGSGLSEKVRQDFSNDVLVEDFEALAKALGLAPPYHFVTVAAAATQALRFLEKHPGRRRLADAVQSGAGRRSKPRRGAR